MSNYHNVYKNFKTDLRFEGKKHLFLKKKIKMVAKKKAYFSKSPVLKKFSQKFHGLVLGFVGLIDAKDIDVVQPI